MSSDRPDEQRTESGPTRPGSDDDVAVDGRPAKAARRWPYRVLIGVGAVVILAAAGFQIHATLWTTHSRRVGHQLVQRFRAHRPVAPTAAGCATTTTTAGGVQGLLIIPKLGVTAPVEDGVGDPQLNVAVGHLPNSVWPGTAGNSVLEAHDVSYFTNLDNLGAGDVVEYESACTNYVFHVQAHDVVEQGSPVYNTPGPSLTLVTCWPTDALWYTPQRYLVTAALVSSSAWIGPQPTYVAAITSPTVAVPAALASQGVTLATYSVPMGTMSMTGSPDPAWAQTTNPLLVQDSAVEAFIAGVRSLSESHTDWWSSFAPGVTAPPPMVGATVHFAGQLDLTLDVNGSTPTGELLTDRITLTGGSAPGTYAVAVDEKITAGALVISGWTLARA